MPIPLRPELRAVQFVSVGPEREPAIALTDPDRIGHSLVLSFGAATLASLMDGHRTLRELQAAFRARTGLAADLADVERIVYRLDEAHLLVSARFERHRRSVVEAYLAAPARPAAHAGAAYAQDPDALRRQLDAMFTTEGGPGPSDSPTPPRGGRLHGLVSPHIDPPRGAAGYAWAYRQLLPPCDTDRFVVFGTAHHPMRQPICVLRKNFETPLGVVQTDRAFIDRLAEGLASSVAGRQLNLFDDETAHRMEHSIEFQAVWLAHVLGAHREVKIVPVLVGSFHEYLAEGLFPGDSPELQAFVAAIRAAAEDNSGRLCFISAADFAHIGPRYGDLHLLDAAQLAAQEADDRQLLDRVCDGDADGFFAHVAAAGDRSRICGLAPTYVMLEALRAVYGEARGRLLHYEQAVESDGSSCVSFAAVAFHGE